jgi:hypothetical protein
MAGEASAQLTDVTQTPNPAGAGIQKSMQQQVGAGRGDELLPGSSIFTIRRDPFRAVARGRQLFQRKFTHAQGLGPRAGDGIGDITTQGALGAGLSDSCASCHGRPRGSAGVGGNVFTRPESRDAPHLFGLGLVEMLGDEITRDLRSIRKRAQARALRQGGDVTASLLSKGIDFGWITARADGTLDTSRVRGVDGDLRVRPFFAQGGTISIREFAVGAFNAEMGLQAFDPDLLAAAGGQDVVTPAGMVLSGSLDAVEAPPANSPAADPDHDGMVDELPASLVDFMEFYLLNYFPPGTGRQNQTTERGRNSFEQIGCAECHVPDLWIDRDRRVADVRTAFDEDRSNGVFNQLFATATTRHDLVQDGSPFPALKPPSAQPFLVRGIFADFRRHDLGSAFHERNFDGSVQTLFMTEPLWGVGSTAPYGHDGRSSTLEDVILRHGGEAQLARDGYLALPQARRSELLAFLSSLVLFSPPDTASNLDPIRPLDPDYPRLGHGSIDLAPLFLVPGDRE